MPRYNTNLTEREKKVARLWFKGLSKEQIAEEVYLSPETINSHIRRIYAKLDVHDKMEFARKMLDKHLVE